MNKLNGVLSRFFFDNLGNGNVNFYVKINIQRVENLCESIFFPLHAIVLFSINYVSCLFINHGVLMTCWNCVSLISSPFLYCQSSGRQRMRMSNDKMKLGKLIDAISFFFILFLEYKSWKIRMQVMNPDLKEEKNLKQNGLSLLPWPNTNGFNLLATPNNNLGLGCCRSPWGCWVPNTCGSKLHASALVGRVAPCGGCMPSWGARRASQCWCWDPLMGYAHTQAQYPLV